jgi:uncharacterized protein DUF6461
MSDAVEYERLVEELADAGCVTAVAGAGMDAVIGCFGGDPGSAPEYGPLGEPGADPQVIGVAQAGPAVVVVEVGGFEGSREAVLRPLSRLGRAASVYWGIDADSALTLAEDGQVLSTFEMLFPDNRQGDRPDAWDPYLTGLTFDSDADGLLPAAGVCAVARATGARLAGDWAAGPFRIVPVEPVREPDLPQGLEDSPLLREQPYARYVADLGPHLLGQMWRYAFDLALRHTGLGGDPLATAAVAEIEHPSTDEPTRTRIRAEVAAARTEAAAGRSELAVRRAELWNLLDMQFTEPALARGAVFLLQRVMTGQGDLVDRYWLLNTLYGAASR